MAGWGKAYQKAGTASTFYSEADSVTMTSPLMFYQATMYAPSDEETALDAGMGIETINFWGSGAWEYHSYLEDITHFMPEGLEMAVLIGGSYAMWLAENA